MRNKLKENNILKLQNNVYVFTDDCLFGSPSSRAAIVLGTRAKGWTEWKNKNKKTIDEIYSVESNPE